LKYIELHARSAFSFLEGASLPEALAAECAKHEMGAMALARSRRHVRRAAILSGREEDCLCVAHIGAEVTSGGGWRYPLLVVSREGYQNLCRLITRMKLRARKNEGHVEEEEVRRQFRGPDLSYRRRRRAAGARAREGGIASGMACVARLAELFGRENVYIELQRHFSREEEARNQAALEIARTAGLPLLATNGVCHALPQEREVLDVFTSLRHHRTLATAGRLLTRNAERHLKAPAEMGACFEIFPKPSPTPKFFPRACNSL
jgi:error-prone DNA polymerase